MNYNGFECKKNNGIWTKCYKSFLPKLLTVYLSFLPWPASLFRLAWVRSPAAAFPVKDITS